MPNFESFNISQVAFWEKDGKVLILEETIHPGKWLIPGGRIDQGEEADIAFARELKEEIGIEKFEAGELIDTTVWYAGPEKVPVCSIMRAISSDEEEVILSDEHLQHKWISEDEINDYEFVWPHAREILKKGFEK